MLLAIAGVLLAIAGVLLAIARLTMLTAWKGSKESAPFVKKRAMILLFFRVGTGTTAPSV
jgi:hypothetical protein